MQDGAAALTVFCTCAAMFRSPCLRLNSVADYTMTREDCAKAPRDFSAPRPLAN